jgi:hypothetical protein
MSFMSQVHLSAKVSKACGATMPSFLAQRDTAGFSYITKAGDRDAYSEHNMWVQCMYNTYLLYQSAVMSYLGLLSYPTPP